MVHISMIQSSTMKRLLSQLGYWKYICISMASHLSKQLNLRVVCKQCGLFQSYCFLHCLPQSMCISSILVLGLDNCRQMKLLSHSILSHCLLFGNQTEASLKCIAQVPLLLFCSSFRQSLQMLSNETQQQKDVSPSICEAQLFQLRFGA